MKQESVNLKVVPDTRRPKDSDRFPLKLRVTYKGNRRYYATGYDASLEEWETINSADAKGNLRKIKNKIAAIEIDSLKCAADISPFSFKQFEEQFFEQKIIFENVESAFDANIAELKANDQIGTATSYQTACNSLHKFKSNLLFEDIDKDFLQKFENWMIANGKSITTVGVYLRPLRVIMNLAKDSGVIKPQDYPFGKRKYVIPTGKNVKKALTKEQIKQVFNYEASPGTNIDKAKDFWIFSYLCNGINIMDIAKLKWKNVNTTTISFIREKTKKTTKGNPIIITAVRNVYIDRIFSKWGKKFISNDDYVFDIIAETDSVDSGRKKIQQFTKVTNKWMKKVGEELGFEIKLTSYVARHSFATILVRSGVPLAFASQCLGHTNILTTQKYFGGFDLAAQIEYTRALTNF